MILKWGEGEGRTKPKTSIVLQNTAQIKQTVLVTQALGTI